MTATGEERKRSYQATAARSTAAPIRSVRLTMAGQPTHAAPAQTRGCTQFKMAVYNCCINTRLSTMLCLKQATGMSIDVERTLKAQKTIGVLDGRRKTIRSSC